MGPGDDWEQSPPTFYGEQQTLEAASAQSFGCMWCMINGVVDIPESVLMFKGSVACTEHLQELIQAGS